MAITTRIYDDATDFLNVQERGVLVGPRANDTERTANTTAFNAAIAEAYNTNKILIVPPGVYQVRGAINIPYSGFRWLGSRRAFITQYLLNVPVVHVGAALGQTGFSCEAVHFDGATLMYNGIGTAGARALEFGPGLFASVFENIDIGDVNQSLAGRTSVPYEGIYFDGTNGSVPPFSNHFRNIRIKHWGYRGINSPRASYDAAATGSVWENIYISGGDSSGQQDTSSISDSCAVFLQMQKQPTVRNLNIEWCKVPSALWLDNVGEMEIDGLNIEGVSLKLPSSGEAGFITQVNSRLGVDGLTIYDNRLLTANNISKAGIFRLYTGSDVRLGNFSVEKTTKTTAPGTPELALVRSFQAGGDSDCTFALDGNMHLGDQDNLNFIDRFAFSGSTFGALVTQQSGFNNNTPCGMPNADATWYAYNTPGVLIGTPSGAPIKWTFSQYVSASDPTVLPRGVTRKVRRDSGTANLLIANFDGNVIATLADAGATVEIVTNESGSWSVVSITGGTTVSGGGGGGGGGGGEPFSPFGLGSHQNEASKYSLWVEAGVQWLRVDFPWSELETSQGSFNWSGWDNATTVAANLGLKVLGCLGYTPGWANGNRGENHVHLQSYEGAWQNYVNQVVTRYSSKVAYWEVWNEPDHDNFFKNFDGVSTWANNNFPGDSAAIRKRRGYKRVVDLALAQAGLASKALTTSGFARGGGYDADFIPWLISSDSAWLKKFSVISHHVYGWNSAQNASSYQRLIDEPAAMQSFGTQIGQTNWPSWITEHGITSGTGAGDDNDKIYLVRSYALAMQQPGVKKLFWFRGGYDPNHRDFMNSSDQRSPVFYAYKTMTSKWVNPTSFASYVNGNVRGTIATLATGVRMAILWCDTGNPAIDSLGLSITTVWDVHGNVIAANNVLNQYPVYVQLSN